MRRHGTEPAETIQKKTEADGPNTSHNIGWKKMGRTFNFLWKTIASQFTSVGEDSSKKKHGRKKMYFI